MHIWNQIVAAVQFISEGAAYAFSLKHDDYPAVGMQSFEGEPFSKWVELNKRW